MSEIVERIGLMLFPQPLRPFLTFQWITVFAVIIGIPTLILRLTVRLPADASPPPATGALRKITVVSNLLQHLANRGTLARILYAG